MFLSFSQAGEVSKINSFNYHSDETINEWHCLDSSFIDRPCHLHNPGHFFDSLGVIHIDWALEIARAEKFVPFSVELIAPSAGNGKSVWKMSAEPKYKYNGRGYGNATIKAEILVIDAKSGIVLERMKEKHRALVDF